MKLLFVLSTLLISLSLAGCHSPGVAAYYRGNTAFEQGNYTSSFTNYLYAARQGITPAQYAVGYQYYYGLGTRPNMLESTKWFKAAAPRSLRAQHALQQIEMSTEVHPWAMGLHWNGKIHQRTASASNRVN